MSYRDSDLAWVVSLPGKPVAKMVLLSLAHHRNSKTGLCCPSVRTICNRTELSRTAVKCALNELERLGLISREHRQAPNGDTTSNRYRLHLSPPPEKSKTDLPTQGGELDVDAQPRSGREASKGGPAHDPSSSPNDPEAAGTRPGLGRHAATNKEDNKEPNTEEYREPNKEENRPEEPGFGPGTRPDEMPLSEPWRGVASSVDPDGWGLDEYGEPLPPKVASSLEVLDRHMAAVRRRARNLRPVGGLPKTGLITAANAGLLKLYQNGGNGREK